jgi:hypothetical protein
VQTLDETFAAIQQIWEDSREDQEFRQWWSRADNFVRKVGTKVIRVAFPVLIQNAIDTHGTRIHPFSPIQ